MDIESQVGFVISVADENCVLKNTPPDELIYSCFEFHITQETKKGCGVLHVHLTIIEKFCLVYFLDNISCSLIFKRALLLCISAFM